MRASVDNECISWFESGARPKPNPFATLYKQHKDILQHIRRYIESKEGYNRQDKKSCCRSKLGTGSFTRLKKLLADHQREEERILIPIVERCFDPNVCNIMRLEHAHIMQSLKQLQEKRLELKGSNVLLHRFTYSATEFEAMVRRQFSLEENVIFWFSSLYLGVSCVQT